MLQLKKILKDLHAISQKQSTVKLSHPLKRQIIKRKLYCTILNYHLQKAKGMKFYKRFFQIQKTLIFIVALQKQNQFFSSLYAANRH